MENVQQEQGLQIVNHIITNKAKETKELIKTQLLKGEANPTYVGVILKKFAKIAEEISKDKKIKELIENDTKGYQEGTAKTFEVFGAKITIASGGFWDYKETEDPLLENLQNIEKIVKEQIKLRKDELQTKALAWQSRNTPQDGINFGVVPYTVSWEQLPELIWNEGAGEVETNPPVKIGKEQLRYSV